MEFEEEEDLSLVLLTPDNRHEHEPLERSLWRNVITQALIDATWPSPNPPDPEYQNVKQDALNFFCWETCLATIKANFEAVCEYAGFTHIAVRATALRYITAGIPFKQRL